MGKTKANKTGQDKAYLHPKSRKAKHLSSFQAHNDKAKKAQDMKMARMQSKATKMMFFKERMEEMFLEDGKTKDGGRGAMLLVYTFKLEKWGKHDCICATFLCRCVRIDAFPREDRFT